MNIKFIKQEKIIMLEKENSIEYRVPPTTETIEGKEYERIHWLDAVAKYPDRHIVFINGEQAGSLEEEPDNFIITIVGVYKDGEDFSKAKLEWKRKGYRAGERRTTEGVLAYLWKY